MEATSHASVRAASKVTASKMASYRTMMAAIASLAIAGLGGCSSGAAPPAIVHTPQTVQLPESGELEVHAHGGPPVGNVLPVEVGVKFIAPRKRTLGDSAVKGVAVSGAPVDTLDADDPAVVANAKELLPIVGGGHPMISYMVEGFGGWGWLIAAGPLAWTVAGIGAAVGSARASHDPAKILALYRLGALTECGGRACERNPGYVFLPNQSYKAIEVTVYNELSGNNEVIIVPWDSAADLEAATAPRSTATPAATSAGESAVAVPASDPSANAASAGDAQ